MTTYFLAAMTGLLTGAGLIVAIGPQNIFVLDQSLVADGRLEKVSRVQLTPGSVATVDTGDGEVKVRFDGAAEYANYQISRDPTQVWALVALK